MSTIQLNGIWLLKDTSSSESIQANVPGTVFSALRSAGLAPDPYYRDHEDAIQVLFESDYEYTREFQVCADDLNSDQLTLILEGIDTLGEIYLNDKLLGHTENMHRTYRFDVRNLLFFGTNKIKVILHSTKKHMKELAPNSPLPSILGNTGVEQIRVAQCAFGWDWGICLPDMGIWRNIYIECTKEAKLEDFYITQDHAEGSVILHCETSAKNDTGKGLRVGFQVESPDGRTFSDLCLVDESTGVAKGTLEITDPQLWWPSGYGDQPLYRLRITLSCDERVLDTKETRVGLRTVELRREDDEYGQSYEFVVNKKALFMRGSNLIIEDAVLSGYSKERTQRMLRDCVKANFNCIRVWGGAIYPDDYFYDICDELGLLVYQDFMFACHAYPASDRFVENIAQEVKDNVKRIRNHACLGLWCGNNENETIIGLYLGEDPMIAPISEALRTTFGFEKPSDALEQKVKNDYHTIFSKTIPSLLNELDPNTSYTRSSPCPKDESFAPFLKSFSNGDCHFYINMLGMMPYKNKNQFHFRFASEIGFQSYPSIKTIRTFTQEDERKPDSPIMYKHQKSGDGNKTIETYMGREFLIPDDFELYVYASQITAGEIQRYAVEHMRRNRGRCMGVITWQLNDCWPVISWSGLDYFGRWKAQQYYSKHFFDPILLSVEEDGTKADVYITNDTFQPVSGILKWALKNSDSTVVIEGECEVEAAALSAKKCIELNFGQLTTDFCPNKQYLDCSMTCDSGETRKISAIFVPAKEFAFLSPEISVSIQDNGATFEIELRSVAYARNIVLDLESDDCVFSDNCFDLSAGESKRVSIDKMELSRELSADEIKRQLKVISAYNLAKQ